MEIDPNEWVTLERCGVENCRSRKYFYDNGYYQCERGHRHHGAPIAGEDDDAFGTQGKTTKQKVEEREPTHQHLRGREGFEHYLLCYQIVLRKQIWWLITKKHFPTELEAVINDLWALRLTKLQDRVTDASDTEGDSQHYSSQSEDEKTSEAQNESDARLRRRGRASGATPRLLDALVLCYLGLICLRLPVTLGDFMDWVRLEKLIYYRAIKAVPLSMRARLPSEYHNNLEPNDVLRPSDLQRTLLDITILYRRDHQVDFPALNVPLLLLRYVQKLTLPIEVYATVFRLAKLVGYTFDFSDARQTRRYRRTDLPEVQLISLLVVAVKILYPFDEIKRHPHHASEPATAVIDWDEWLSGKMQPVTDSSPTLAHQDMFRIKEADVFSMNPSQLDSYLDWYHEIWADEEQERKGKDSDFRAKMFEMFPVTSEEPSQHRIQSPVGQEMNIQNDLAQLLLMHTHLKVVKPVAKDQDSNGKTKMVRPGGEYRYFRQAEELPPTGLSFYQEAAGIAGVSLKSLIGAVFSTEMAISKWLGRERGKERRSRATETSKVAPSIES